ncbi:MAG: hypothetical protein WCS84_16855 [Nocardioides sp.]
MNPLPEELSTGPFTRSRALELGVASDMFKGRRFVRVFPRVWRLREHRMSHRDWVRAAQLSLPPTAYLTGISRLQQLGLDFGPRAPLHFVRQGPLHLDIDGIFLHRTKQLAPIDDVGVTPAAAFLFYCSHARVVDAIKVGDWLLSHSHMTKDELRALALSALWRDGADEALWVLPELDGRSWSLKESETRAVLCFAGLPRPEPNATVPLADDAVALGDLVFRPWGVVVEYEGAHHQEERAQYSSDLDRYALFRTHGIAYVQVTHEKLDRARTLVGEVFRLLVDQGYDGPAPALEERWRSLFRPIRESLGPRVVGAVR